MAISYFSTSQSSMLPYLQLTRGESALGLSLYVDSPLFRDRAFPFAVVEDNDYNSRIIAAEFVTDAGGVLKKVFLLVQKDQYSLREHDHGPVTNADIDVAWQRAYQSLQQRASYGPLLKIAAQTDLQGGLERLAPLFFCREMLLYFHPTCSSCGQPLQLCTDDILLKQLGLHPYATSTKRYLYCATCCELGEQEFYLYERDATDPVTIKDRWSLIDRFRLITPDKDLDGEFPCARCQEVANCYGPNQYARTRITPFSFYPFYFLIYDAPSLHANDFLHLVSGATLDEIEGRLDPLRHLGRLRCVQELRQQGLSADSFGHPAGEQQFLEILTTKLTFLDAILDSLTAVNCDSVPTVNMERTWVQLPAFRSPAKAISNFGLVVIDDVKPGPHGTGKDVAANLYGRLAISWFQTLVQNIRVQGRDIVDRVNQYISHAQRGISQSGPAAALSGLTDPAHIFWNPAGQRVCPDELLLWEQALAPGMALLEAAVQSGSTVSLLEISETVHRLLKEISQQHGAVRVAPDLVSQGGPSFQDAQAVLPADIMLPDDGQIRKTLLQYMEKCRHEHRQLPPQFPVEVKDEDDEEVATIILARPQVSKAEIKPDDDDDMITETVMLGAPLAGSHLLPAGNTTANADGMMETMMFTPGQRGPQSSTAGNPARDSNSLLDRFSRPTEPSGAGTDSLAETVIAHRPGQPVGALGEQVGNRRLQTHLPPTAAGLGSNLLEETVLVRQPFQQQRSANSDESLLHPASSQGKAGADEADQLDETVMIMPKGRPPRSFP
jgi:hypothetical protein